jgi:hypothetical protein
MESLSVRLPDGNQVGRAAGTDFFQINLSSA